MLIDDFGCDGLFMISSMAPPVELGEKRKHQDARQANGIVSALFACSFNTQKSLFAML